MTTAAYANGVIYATSNDWEIVGDFERDEDTARAFALDARDG